MTEREIDEKIIDKILFENTVNEIINLKKKNEELEQKVIFIEKWIQDINAGFRPVVRTSEGFKSLNPPHEFEGMFSP